ncbi:MAG: hypothetical protein ACOY3P_05235, partial [Planctomycetota bacterium]
MITIRRKWLVDGVLTDVTSAVLRDATGTYGVKRDDTDEVVVASGTAMTHVSTGVYEYTFEEPAAGLTYAGWVEFVYAGSTYRFEHEVTGSVSMAEMAVSYESLRRAIARFLGFGRSSSDWTEEQSEDLNDIVTSGLRRFYTPPPLPGEKYAHEWSFLTPATTLVMTVGSGTYDLPADFAGLEGPITYAPGETALYSPIEITSEHRVRMLQQREVSGRPTLAAIRPKAVNPATGTRWEILFDREADAAYVLTYRYRVNSGVLTTVNKYPYGGQDHAETILEACLA